MADWGDASPRDDARLAEIRALAAVGARERGDARARRMIFEGETRTIWCDPRAPLRIADIYDARCAEREARLRRSTPPAPEPFLRISRLVARLEADLAKERHAAVGSRL